MKQGEEKREKETEPLIWLCNVLSSWGGESKILSYVTAVFPVGFKRKREPQLCA